MDDDEKRIALGWAKVSEAEKYDKSLVEIWKSVMEGILIFAGVFSASLTAFIDIDPVRSTSQHRIGSPNKCPQHGNPDLGYRTSGKTSLRALLVAIHDLLNCRRKGQEKLTRDGAD
ncbi:hypothetical protein B0H13DRAFT_1908025 [Mycena leptocephala]|nr:hypothetical protein B0H13DRAFT_1908025 [Mycena leptocephala]